MAFGYYIRRYGLSVFFPTFVTISILADYLHTRRWKQQKQLLSTKKEELNYS